MSRQDNATTRSDHPTSYGPSRIVISECAAELTGADCRFYDLELVPLIERATAAY
ncbi:hypothetical protein OSH08_05250 [Kaistia geumhonensis]|uniref:Uncharacterized protein n=1 Tax=Kaistia geumhonensis TaxID=410839 RepID=A0ABU0M5Z6_9HYPH|nr:hypothetical protein [Kaistia geumhonensis]MCX5478398.1 hypothetical protein [Kaistia geumhonensis]MDQ0516384.1 hypothetical protein [Kaistia geumhonensis]